MKEASPDSSGRTGIILFRAFCLYLILYFIFISDFASNYRIIWHIDSMLKSISNRIGLLLNKLFFSPDFKEWRFFDSYWTYSKLLLFLVLALSGSVTWTILDKAKGSRKLFIFMHAFCRFYLGIAMLLYSMWKLFEIQFYLEPKNFLLPIGYYGPRSLFWTFIASSKSYPMLGGILEALAGIMLLFRRTATLGALISSALLFDILVMDIAYDTPIKVIVFHLLLFNALILWPDSRKIFAFFVQGKTEKLTPVSPIIDDARYKKWGYGVKALVLGIAIIPILFANRAWINRLNHPPYENIVGVHLVDSAAAVKAGKAYRNPKSWQKMAIEAENAFYVLTPEDSLTGYKMEPDTLNKSFRVFSGDSVFYCKLNYSPVDSVHWLFEGQAGADSIRIVTRQIDIHKLPLLRENGKIIWSWITPP